MENFVVSARKYRPKTFEEVVGQAHVTSTLEKAIESDHLAQALLFTGPRGVGKTTCARILAKRINEEEGLSEDDFSLNIFELDAASNNSVDDIRNLIDQVRFAPQKGRYKIYIIDEVHMLSQNAFNAFLKTLEEPPKHAIFILATTEKHKIIPTILSRCQIYDFRRIGVEDIAKHLKGVAQQEGITAESRALHIIAEKADGALRDALSIFDRIASFSGKELTYKAVIDNLRILDYDYYFKTCELIANQDHAGLLSLFNDILKLGFDGHLFINGLASHFRDLLVSKDAKTLNLLEINEDSKENYKNQSAAFPVNWIFEALSLLSKVDTSYKMANNPRLLVEICLMELSQLGQEKKKSEPKHISAPSPITPQSKIAVKPIEKKTTIKEEVSQVLDTKERAIVKENKTEHISSEVISQVPIQEASENYPSPTESKVTPEEQAKATANEGAIAKRARNRRSSISISKGLEIIENKEAGEEIDELAALEDMPKTPFTLEQYTKFWKEHLDSNLDDFGKQYQAAVMNKEFKLLDNFKVQIQLETDIQAELVSKLIPDAQRFLREKLNNYSLRIEYFINPSKRTAVPYSPEEKFEYMAEKNPSLKDLKRTLDLDLE